MPEVKLSNFVVPDELDLMRTSWGGAGNWKLYCQKRRLPEVCPRCACLSDSTYDHRTVRIKDEPVRGKSVTLLIRKRRLWCAPCKKPFSSPIPGVMKKHRTTQRYRRSVLWAAENFTDLTAVRRAYRCSSAFLYKILYEQLELRRRRHNQYPWPRVVGIDEHGFGRSKQTRQVRFASMIVDYPNKKVMEVVEGKTAAALEESLKHIPQRENVNWAVIDLCDPYKSFIKEFFPKAEIIADKFHVLRLLSPALLRKRKEISGDRATLRTKKLLLMSSKHLDYWSRKAIWDFLESYPEMKELYSAKEALHGFYRIKGHVKASHALTAMTDRFAESQLPEIKTLRRTLIKWREEILNYFKTGITNARTEGFNNKAKLVKRRGYGYRNFNNYRLRVLNACS